MKTKEEILENIIENAFDISVNLSDTFHYACADSETISGEDYLELIPLIQKYGYYAEVAYFSLKRGYDPQVKKVLTPEFYQALSSKFICIENDLNITKQNALIQIRFLLEGNTTALLLFPSFFKKCLSAYIEADCAVFSHDNNISNGFFSIGNNDKLRSCKYKSQILAFNISKFMDDYHSMVSSRIYSQANCDYLTLDESVVFSENEYFEE